MTQWYQYSFVMFTSTHGSLLLLFLSYLLPVYCGSGTHWDYKLEGSHGPSNWKDTYPDCKGTQQSPISIPTKVELPQQTHLPLTLLGHDLSPGAAVLRNNGHTAKLSTTPEKPEYTPIMSGGGLPNSYKFAQIHFHWGADDTKGSEHVIGDTAYPMEMHLVHYKAEHKTIGDALGEGAYDSLAVLGVFFKVGEHPNPGLEHLIPYLNKVKAAETKVEDVSPFPITDFLTGDLSKFYRYNGSLTTPSCNEIVQWTVVKEPVSATKEQLEAFRNILDKDDAPIVDNFRPPQELGTREVVDVETVKLQRLTMGSQKESPADRVRAMGAWVLGMVMASLV